MEQGTREVQKYFKIENQIENSNTKTVSPKEYAEEAKKWIEAGAYVVGGCCSTGPEHIKEISNLLLD